MAFSACTVTQIIVLAIVIPLICVLMTLPTIFYFVDLPESSTGTTSPGNGTSGNCSATVYTGSTCSDILLGLQSCIPGRAGSSEVYISKGDGQDDREANARTMDAYLSTNSEPECADIALPFICLSFFGLCDGDGNEYLPTEDQCVRVSEEVCVTEWELATRLLGDDVPVCDQLPDTTVDCDATPDPGTPAPPTAPTCSEYTGSVCMDALQQYYNCIPGQENSSSVYIFNGNEMELSAGMLIGALQANGSQECIAAAVPLLCQYLFAPCDENGTYLPSRSQCEDVSTGVCNMEFLGAAAAGLDGLLPQCDLLPNTTIECNITITPAPPTAPTCSEYTGSVCMDALQQYYNCIPGQENSSSVYIFNGNEMELSAGLLIGGLRDNGSPECLAAAVPLLCQYLFAPCDENGTYLPSRSQCEDVSTGVCNMEFLGAAALGLGSLLPQCDLLPNTTIECNITITPAPPTAPTCSEYTGSVCMDALQQYYNCIPGQENSSSVYIANGNEMESSAGLLIGGLQAQGRLECLAVAVPLLCQYLFAPCDENGVYLPSRSQCEDVSTSVCDAEFAGAAALGLDGLLPQCDLLPDTTVECSTATALNCSEDFFYNTDAGTCDAECGEWSFYSDTITKGAMAVIIIFCCVGIVSTIAILILTCVRPRRMLGFPTVFSVYTSVSVMVLNIFFLIGYTDRPGLFCVQQDLVDIPNQRINGPSQFCTATGVVFTYVLLQLACWWVFQVASVCCSAIFPSLYAQATRKRWINLIIHLTVVGVCIILPCIPFIVALSTEGFGDALGLAPLCTPQTEVTYYALVLPISIIVAMGVSMGLIVLTQVIKFSCCSQEDSWSPVSEKYTKCSHMTRRTHIATLILSIHFVFLALFYMSAYIWSFLRAEPARQEFFVYLLCESGGVESAGPDGCSREGFAGLTFPILFNLSLVLVTLFPVSNLIYALTGNGSKEKSSSNGKLGESQIATIPLENKPISGTNPYSEDLKTSM